MYNIYKVIYVYNMYTPVYIYSSPKNGYIFPAHPSRVSHSLAFFA